MTIQDSIIEARDVSAGDRTSISKFIFGILISLLFLGMVVYKVDFFEVYRIVLQTSVAYLVLSVILLVMNLVFRAWRWKIILKPVKPVRFADTFAFLLVGFLGNNILPFRAGELGRSVLLGRRENISKSSVLASVVVERVLDLFSLSVLLLTFYWSMGGLDQKRQLSSVFNGTALIISLIVIAFLIMLLRGREIDRVIEKRVLLTKNAIEKGVLERLHYFLRGFAIIRDKKSLIPLIAGSFTIWLITVLTTGARFLAFDLDLPFEAAMFVVLVVNFASAFPSSPGQIGVAHYAFVFALSLYGVDKETAVAYGIVSHALTFLTTSLMGAVAFRFLSASAKLWSVGSNENRD